MFKEEKENLDIIIGFNGKLIFKISYNLREVYLTIDNYREVINLKIINIKYDIVLRMS